MDLTPDVWHDEDMVNDSGDRGQSAGGWLVSIGITLPVVATAIALMACFEPCGGGGPGTCMFGHSTCEMNPGFVWLLSSFVGFVLIFIGREMQRP